MSNTKKKVVIRIEDLEEPPIRNPKHEPEVEKARKERPEPKKRYSVKACLFRECLDCKPIDFKGEPRVGKVILMWDKLPKRPSSQVEFVLINDRGEELEVDPLYAGSLPDTTKCDGIDLTVYLHDPDF